MQIPKPSLPCPVSRHQGVTSLQTNSTGKPARRNDKGVCEFRRFPPIWLDRAVDHLFLTWISDTLARALIKQLLCILWNAGPDDAFKFTWQSFFWFSWKSKSKLVLSLFGGTGN